MFSTCCPTELASVIHIFWGSAGIALKIPSSGTSWCSEVKVMRGVCESHLWMHECALLGWSVSAWTAPCFPCPGTDMADFREVFAKAKHIAIITGAGVSAESGVPTFRGAGGFWRKWQAQVGAGGPCLSSCASLSVHRWAWRVRSSWGKRVEVLPWQCSRDRALPIAASAVLPCALGDLLLSFSLSVAWVKQHCCRQLWVFLPSLFSCSSAIHSSFDTFTVFLLYGAFPVLNS